MVMCIFREEGRMLGFIELKVLLKRIFKICEWIRRGLLVMSVI